MTILRALFLTGVLTLMLGLYCCDMPGAVQLPLTPTPVATQLATETATATATATLPPPLPTPVVTDEPAGHSTPIRQPPTATPYPYVTLPATVIEPPTPIPTLEGQP